MITIRAPTSNAGSCSLRHVYYTPWPTATARPKTESEINSLRRRSARATNALSVPVRSAPKLTPLRKEDDRVWHGTWHEPLMEAYKEERAR